MKYALINNEIKHIDEVKRGENGICPVCKTEMIAKKGNVKQYFAHIINTDIDCEEKYKQNLREIKVKEKEIVRDKYQDLYDNIYNKDVEDSLGFTEEQLQIINSTENRIMVNSVSGSGKTSTIEEFIKRNPDKQVLYLVFNRSMALEASERFEGVDNVLIKTIHSFAYKYFGNIYRSTLSNNINIFDVAKALKVFIKEPEEFQYMESLLDKFDTYLLSSSKSIDEFCNKNSINKKYNKDLKILFEASRTGAMKITHNFYYKLWHLSDPQFEEYDILAVDEVQDVNEAMVDILSRNSTLEKIVIIGDSNQSLYKFAKCVNAFELLDKDVWKEYKLTKSFRIGNTLAKVIEKSYKDKIFENFNMVGMNKKQLIKEKVDRTKPYYELCRYNATIIKNSILSALDGKKVYIEGGKAGISFSFIENIYEFKFHNKRHYTLKKYESYSHMINLANKTSNYELLFADKLIKSYGESLLMYIRSAKENLVNNWTEADVCYSTLHKSKGKTITIPLVINEDCTSILELSEKENLTMDDFITESNLLYVGCTRCKYDIEIPDNLFELYENQTNLLDMIFNIFVNNEVKDIKTFG